MIAIKRLWSIMWILVIAAGALTAYLVSLRVATERNAVKAIERQIYGARANIRYLEVEFSARANIRQLAEWNARDIKYSVPGPGQYLSSERQLASLDSIEPSGQPTTVAPVMAAMAQNEQTHELAPAMPASAMPASAMPSSAMIVPVKAEVPAKPARDQGFALVRTASAAEPLRPKATAAVAIAKPEAAPRIVKLVDKVAPKRSARDAPRPARSDAARSQDAGQWRDGQGNALMATIIARPERRTSTAPERIDMTTAAHGRVMLLLLLMLAVTLVLAARMVWIGVEANARADSTIAAPIPIRADIVDRNGVPLARNIDGYAIAVHPDKIMGDRAALAERRCTRSSSSRAHRCSYATLNSGKGWPICAAAHSPPRSPPSMRSARSPSNFARVKIHAINFQKYKIGLLKY